MAAGMSMNRSCRAHVHGQSGRGRGRDRGRDLLFHSDVLLL